MGGFWSTGRPAPGRLTGLFLAGGLLIAAAAASPLRLGIVRGESMEPTLRCWQPFLYEPLRSTPGRPAPVERGEMVVLQIRGQLCVKRVYALGGDVYWTVGPGGADAAQRTPLGLGDPVGLWMRRFPEFVYRSERVPAGMVFVVGDGTTSSDSRSFGPLPLSCLKGRVVLPAAVPPPAGGPVAYWADCPPRPGAPPRRG